MRSLIFDTSAINALADDPRAGQIICGLCLYDDVRITETSISEVVATKSRTRRMKLLAILKCLCIGGRCILPFHAILKRLVRSYENDPEHFEWRNVGVSLPEAEEEITKQRFLHGLSDKLRSDNRKLGKAFEDIYRTARPAFDKIYAEPNSTRHSLQELIDVLLGDAGTNTLIGIRLFELATQRLPEVREFRAFLAKCPPFCALLIALCVVQHDRVIRAPSEPSLWDAGRLDMFSAVYLLYSDRFVTDDSGQFKALAEVARRINPAILVETYSQFRKSFNA